MQSTHPSRAANSSGVRPPGRQPFVARLGGDLPFPLLRVGACVHVRAASQQFLQHRRMALRGRPHQRGLTVPRLPCLEVRAVVEQRAGCLDVSASGNRHQRRLAVRADGVRVGAGLEQAFDHGGVAVDRGEMQRRHAVTIRRSNVGAVFQQPVDDLGVALPDGPVQRGGAIGFGRERLIVLAGQLERGAAIAALQRLHELRRRGGSCESRDAQQGGERRCPDPGVTHADAVLTARGLCRCCRRACRRSRPLCRAA